MNQQDLPTSPRENANFLSKLSFTWLIDLFELGRKKDLELSDIYRLPEYDCSKELGGRLEDAWKNEIKRCEKINEKAGKKAGRISLKMKTPSLLRAMCKVFFWKYFLLGFWAFIEECFLKIAQPICLGLLIRYFGGEFREGGYEGYLFAGGIVLSASYYTFQHHPFFFAILHNGMQMRVACCSVIYRKSLKLSQSALGQTTIGQMVNLLSNDVNRFDLSTTFFHYLYIGPIQLLIVIFILWRYFGATCLYGLIVLILFIPFQGMMGRLFSRLRLATAIKTDKRIRIMNEIISAIRVIKMYCWEARFAELIEKSREEEILVIKKTSVLKAINLSFYYISSKIIVFVTLLAYVLTGNGVLNSEKVFVTLALYNNVRLIMTLFFPYGIAQLAETLISIQRIQNFLLLEERFVQEEEDENLDDDAEESYKKEKENGESYVKIKDLSAKWNPDSKEMTLSNISLEVKSGELLAVIGPVGSGKGSLLQIILNELPKLAGNIDIRGNIGYCAQQAIVFGGSVRDNILFGRPYDEQWYNMVIDACSLRRDLSLFPFGDYTLVGERGASLSGGQKARINLARAVYADADIYLLDDPLSAVDTEVARHLFENCITGLLRKKLIILVTHQIQFLKPAKEIILLNNGLIEARGKLNDLLKSQNNFAQFLLLNEEQNNLPILKKTLSEISIGAKPEFRRSSSLSQLEMNICNDIAIPTEFDEGLDDCSMSITIAKSLQFQDHRKKDMDKKSLLLFRSLKKDYGTFIDRKSSQDCEKPIMHEEMMEKGNIGFSTYWKYIHAGSNFFTLMLLILSNIITQVLFTGSDYWLQFWTKVEELNLPIEKDGNSSFIENNSTNSSGVEGWDTRANLDPTLNFFINLIGNDRQTMILAYSVIIGALFVVSLGRTSGFFLICMRSSINLHKRLFAGVLRAPMRFFELNPVGRILNRFAKDIGIVDELLPPTLFDTMEVALQVIGIIVIVSIINPFMLIPSVLIAIMLHFIRKYYLYTARDIKRLEGISRSPVFSHLSNSLYGISTIRAFKVEDQFIKQFDAYQDMHSSCWYLFLGTARFLGIVVDYISVVYIGLVTFSFLFFDEGGAAVGLAVSSALSLVGLFQWGVRQSSELENQFVSVERIVDYSNLETEAPFESEPGRKPPNLWPYKGEIRMDQVSLKYGDDPPVLNDITFVIKAKEKIGIVGRTGAGKSSLVSSLFRLEEPCDGIIQIDGINTLRIGLHDVRSKISIIPQDPVLFIGSLRKNLDPFSEYNDAEIWKVLEEVYLVDKIWDIPSGLNIEIAEGGSNFSVGERQLICLARAILRKNKILILDEATANVDPETDSLIQTTIRNKFCDCTVLTIAHRLHTVMDSDRILVLDAGRIKEFDEPYFLLSSTNRSALGELVEQTGKQTASTLYQIAKNAFEKRKSQSMRSVVELNEDNEEILESFDKSSTFNSLSNVI